MNQMKFSPPVRVLSARGKPAEQIETVEQALAFLQRWPNDRRGPVFRCALDCCSAALAAQISTENARRSFTSFARITGLLAKDRPTPAMLPTGDKLKVATW